MVKYFPGTALTRTLQLHLVISGENLNKSFKPKNGTAPPRDPRPQTKDVTGRRGVDFDDFGIKKELLMGICECGYEWPSPIQEESIPVIMQGRDVLARAKNGTGKTASFVIPILDRIDTSSKAIQAIILTPTRELALQTCQVCKSLAKYTKVNIMTTTGGTYLRDDILRLQEAGNLRSFILYFPDAPSKYAQSSSPRSHSWKNIGSSYKRPCRHIKCWHNRYR